MEGIATLTDISAMSFGEHIGLFNRLQQQVEEKPETAYSLLPDFYRLLEGKGTSSDMLPMATRIFAEITKHLSKSQIVAAVDKLYALDKNILIDHSGDLLCKFNPNCADCVFNRLFEQIRKQPYSDENKNFLTSTTRKLTNIISTASDLESQIMWTKMDTLPQETQELYSARLGGLYVHKPVLRPALWHQISGSDCEDSSQFSILYKNLGQVCGEDPSKVSDCLSLISESITDSKQDASSLKNAFVVLGQIRQNYPQKEKIDAVLMRGLQHRANNLSSRREAFRQMGKSDELTSRSVIGKRIAKTDDNPHGFQTVDNMDINATSVLFLGGNNTLSDKSANGYLSSVEKLLQMHNVKEPVALYAAVYDFGAQEDRTVTFNENLARTKLMQDYHRPVKLKKELNEDTLHPRYVEDIFKKAFLPRLCGKDGKRLPTEEVCRNMRKLTIIAHCHGAYTFLKLEQKMQEKMTELGYIPEERDKILHEVLCVAHAPYAPLGVSKSTMISFASAQDFEVNHYNNFEYEIQHMNSRNEVKLGYFPAEKGEVFLTPSMGKEAEQHNFLGYDYTQPELSPEGQVLLKLAGNTIVNGIQNSIEGKALPRVKEIVCGQDEKSLKVWESLAQNGTQMWKQIEHNAAVRLKAKKAAER